MRIVGYRRADFAGEDGKNVTGNNIYIATEINPSYGVGVSVALLLDRSQMRA